MKKHLSYLFVFFMYFDLQAQNFIKSDNEIVGVRDASIKWADFDNDGDLDFLLTGSKLHDLPVTKLYENFEGHFIEKPTNLPQLNYSAVDWGDYDTDGDLDILISGSSTGLSGPPLGSQTKIYQNNQGNFLLYETDLAPVLGGDAKWIDIDNDGDLDVFITGIHDGTIAIDRSKAKIYRNENGKFIDTMVTIKNTNEGKTAWGDYDNDGDQDIAITGFIAEQPVSTPTLKLYRNDNSNFIEVEVPDFVGVYHSSLKWGDYDNDGDLDLLVAGSDNYGYNSPLTQKLRLYENQNCGFVLKIIDNFGGLGDVDWGDYDNDGDLDILATSSWIGSIAANVKIYRNDTGKFVDTNADVIQLSQGVTQWGDYDNDGDLDFIVSGLTYNVDPEKVEWHTAIYNNSMLGNSFKSNTRPRTPINLSSNINENTVNLSWDGGGDDETDIKALTFNVYLFSESTGKFITSPMSNLDSGRRLVVSTGNSSQSLNYIAKNLPKGRYRWSVQSIDQGFLASQFSVEQYFVVKNDPLPMANTFLPNVITPNGDGLNDTFVIKNYSDILTLKIFNRWGKLIYHKDDYRNDWDAKGVNGGTYYYLLNASEECDSERKVLKGWLEVIK